MSDEGREIKRLEKSNAQLQDIVVSCTTALISTVEGNAVRNSKFSDMIINQDCAIEELEVRIATLEELLNVPKGSENDT